MIDSLYRRHTLGVFTKRVACIHVAVDPREIAARNVYSDAMPSAKDNTCDCQVDAILVNLSRVDKLRLDDGLAVSSSNASFCQLL